MRGRVRGGGRVRVRVIAGDRDRLRQCGVGHHHAQLGEADEGRGHLHYIGLQPLLHMVAASVT